MTHITPEAAREAGTPWYHSLKLIADDFCTVDGYKTRIGGPYRFGNPQTSRTICTIHSDFDRSAPKDPYNLSFKRAEQFAALFAAAPETATERDALKAQVAKQDEVIRAWSFVASGLEAHLEDRVSQKDPAKPEVYLSILRSSVRDIDRTSDQFLASRHADYKRHQDVIARLEAKVSELTAQNERQREALVTAERHLTNMQPHIAQKPVEIGAFIDVYIDMAREAIQAALNPAKEG